MSQQYKNPFDDESLQFFVLINMQQQYSLWPEFAAIPAGWKSVFGPAGRDSCIACVEQEWRDMRPAGLRSSSH